MILCFYPNECNFKSNFDVSHLSEKTLKEENIFNNEKN